MCKAGFFMNYVNARYSGSLLEFERRVCDSCPAVGGYDCSLPGNALETLRIRPGYSRSYNLSTTVFQCVRKKFCTGTNAILNDSLALDDVVSNLNVGRGCAPNHAGPLCELCADSFILTSEGCVKCTGDRNLSFVLPGVAIALAVAVAIYCCRSGRLKAFADLTMEATRGSEDALEAVKLAAESQIKRKVEGKWTKDEERDSTRERLAAGDVVSAESTSLAEDSPSISFHPSPPASPPLHSPPPPPDSQSPPPDSPLETPPPLGSVLSLDAPTKAPRKSRTRSTRRSALKVTKLTKQRMVSLQVKFRILVSLVQVVAQIGIVFSIPYPEFYDALISILGIFTLDLIEVMPLKCSIPLNQDHYLLIRTLVPIVLLLLSAAARRCLLASAARKCKACEGLSKDDPRAKQLYKQATANVYVYVSTADQLVSYLFLLFYLLYPSTSANIFATLQCVELDGPDGTTTSFLRSDVTVDCNDPFHKVHLEPEPMAACIPQLPRRVPELNSRGVSCVVANSFS